MWNEVVALSGINLIDLDWAAGCRYMWDYYGIKAQPSIKYPKGADPRCSWPTTCLLCRLPLPRARTSSISNPPDSRLLRLPPHYYGLLSGLSRSMLADADMILPLRLRMLHLNGSIMAYFWLPGATVQGLQDAFLQWLPDFGEFELLNCPG